MKDVLLIINMVISLLIIGLVLMQGGGAGLGSAWGGGGEVFQTRRGIERWTLKLTIFLIILFFVVSVTNLML